MNVDDSDDRIDRDILDALRRDGRVGAPRAARERVFRRVTLGAAVLGAATTAGTGGAVAAVGAAASYSTFAVISALVVGAGIGFGTHSALDAIEAPATPAPLAVTRAAQTAARVQDRAPAPAPEPTVTVNPMPDLPEPGPTLAPAPGIRKPAAPNPFEAVPKAEPPGLAAQQALLDEARSALRRHEGARALSAVGAHRLRFPETELLEERSALEIRALAALGRVEEARRLYDAFAQRFPGSLFAESLRNVVMTSPADSVTDRGHAPQMAEDGQPAERR